MHTHSIDYAFYVHTVIHLEVNKTQTCNVMRMGTGEYRAHCILLPTLQLSDLSVTCANIVDIIINSAFKHKGIGGVQYSNFYAPQMFYN